MDTSIQMVLNKTKELMREYQRLRDVDRQVEALRYKLEVLKAWVQVAEERNWTTRDQLVRVWVQQLRRAVFDTEDIIDDYIEEVYKSRPESRSETRWQCISWLFPLSEIFFRYNMSKKITEVLGRLGDIQNMESRVEALPRNRPALDVPTRETFSYLPRPWSVVIPRDFANVITSLLLEDNGREVADIAVTGESGIGKTTVARAVLGNWDVRKHFDVCAFACLPPKSRLDMYLDQIWEQAQEQTHCDCPRREDVKKMLFKMKLLVVLDGMDSIDELMVVLRELPRGAKGSRIVVTTQLAAEKIEQHIRLITTVEIKCLQQSDCLVLLRSGLSGRYSEVFKNHGRELGDKIYDISRGLPLAVVLLGGLLCFNDHITQWKEVFRLLESEENNRLIKRILTVSYETMPTAIKLCFLYLAAIPPNVHLNLQKLKRLWSAEGIASSLEGEHHLDYIVDHYLDVLTSRGLVQLVEADTKICIHQTVHRFAKTKANEAILMEDHNHFDILGASSVHGLSIHNYVSRQMQTGIKKFPKLRTLFCDFAEEYVEQAVTPPQSQASRSNHLNRFQFLCHSRFLRVLDVKGVKLGHLPDCIGHMIHLRYLGLRSCFLQNLPNSVAELMNLETLDITDNEIQSVVDEFWKIKKLKHVLAQNLSMPVSETSMSSKTSLETLHGVTMSSLWTQENCPLKKLQRLLSFAVVDATDANMRVLKMALLETEGLQSLRHMKIAGDCCIPLMFSHRIAELRSLELDGVLLIDEVAAQSANYQYPIQAYRVVLRSTCMSQQLLDRFIVDSVTELELLDNSFTESKLLLQGHAFQGLSNLKIGNLKVLEELVVIGNAMPDLMTFEIFGCPNMKRLQGLNSRELKNVTFFDMPALVAQIEAEDKDLFDKVRHVSSAAWANAA